MVNSPPGDDSVPPFTLSDARTFALPLKFITI